MFNCWGIGFLAGFLLLLLLTVLVIHDRTVAKNELLGKEYSKLRASAAILVLWYDRARDNHQSRDWAILDRAIKDLRETLRSQPGGSDGRR